MVKRIAILGSTGSIGKNALRVIDALGMGYEVAALSAHSRFELLAEQVRRYKPRFAAITNGDFAEEFRGLVGDLDVKVLSGPEGLAEIAQLGEVDIVLTAVVGAAGLPAVLSAAKAGKTLAIANKEPLVIAGELLTQTVKKNGGKILRSEEHTSEL